MVDMQLEDLEEEAGYIKRQMENLTELRRQHRKRVLEQLSKPEADVPWIIAILDRTEQKGLE